MSSRTGEVRRYYLGSGAVDVLPPQPSVRLANNPTVGSRDDFRYKYEAKIMKLSLRKMLAQHPETPQCGGDSCNEACLMFIVSHASIMQPWVRDALALITAIAGLRASSMHTCHWVPVKALWRGQRGARQSGGGSGQAAPSRTGKGSRHVSLGSCT